ncbi:hypothetical protein EV356DRAFT_198056 [Viridothelium virens]|uniref:Ubiquitin-like domain-containing protein n=1 Tax=Viridothelium virens TaxID=1048519 RepID=A0A6A6H683_VIRVR|nr:hypothetical protein EV356DRAFT_198056 [Viridothelium virens]
MQSYMQSPETMLKASKPLSNLLTEEPNITASLTETYAIKDSETGDTNSVEGSPSTSSVEMSQTRDASQIEQNQESALDKIMTSSRQGDEAAGALGPMALVPHFRFLFVQEKLSEFASDALTTLVPKGPEQWSSRASNASETSRSSNKTPDAENLSPRDVIGSSPEDKSVENDYKATFYESKDDFSTKSNGLTNSVIETSSEVFGQDAPRGPRTPRGRMSSEPSSIEEPHNRTEKTAKFEKPVKITTFVGDFSIPWEVAKKWKTMTKFVCNNPYLDQRLRDAVSSGRYKFDLGGFEINSQSWELIVQPGRSFSLSIGTRADFGEPYYAPDDINYPFNTAKGGSTYPPWPGQPPASPFPMPPPDHTYSPYFQGDVPEGPKEKQNDNEYKQLKELLANMEVDRIKREEEIRAREAAQLEAKKRAEEAARALELAASNARKEAEMKAVEEAERAKEEADRALKAAMREAEDARQELERQRNKKWWNRLGPNSGSSSTKRTVVRFPDTG